jgi:hypothetical protein
MNPEVQRERYWIARHYVAASTMITLLIVLLAPGSLNYKSVEAAGPIGWYVLGVLFFVSLLSLVDSSIMRLMPQSRTRFLKRWRHLTFMAIGLGQLSLSFVVLSYAPENWVILLRFGLDATVATAIAFFDLFARHKAGEVA